MENRPFITVFTPVYNRGYCVRNVYESLLSQSFENFEWLVINDGSTDNTEEVIQNCIKENKLVIHYIVQTNGGQHRALNRAIEQANGTLLMIVDSDDVLTNDALEMIRYYEQSLHDRSLYAGVSGLRCYKDGKIIGSKWPVKNDFVDINGLQRFKYNMLLGDKAEAYYTDVLRRFYPIPCFQNENDVEKGVLWNRIAYAGYKIRWFNKPIYICEYLKDGMSRNIIKNYIKNFYGYAFYIKEFIHYDIGFIRKIKTIIVTCEISHKRKIPVKELSSLISYSYRKLLLLNILSYLSPMRKLKKYLTFTYFGGK